MTLIPQIDNQIENVVETTQLPSKTYKLNTSFTSNTEEGQQMVTIEASRIIGFVDKLEAIRQAVYHILSVERYAYLIYDENYGIELEQYIGADLEYIQSTIENTLKEALMHDLRINDVVVTNIEQVSSDIVEVYFNVYSIYGNLQMEVNVNV